jgi:hypothetical protein
MKSLLSRNRVEPLLLFLFAVLAYGLFIPKLGLFGDDWPHLWVFHMFGLDGLNQLVAWDRPFSSWVYWIIAPLAGENIWAYHLYLLILRWICALIFYYLVIELFPESHPLPFWAAAFFLLYPGFRQQPQPIEFILHFTALGLMLASFWLMIQAYKNQKKAWLYQIIGSIAALCIFSVEYFIGLELLRPIILWFIIRRSTADNRTAIRKVLMIWLPYIAILSFYAYWRVFVFKFPTYKPTFLNQMGSNPLNAIAGLGQILAEEIRAAILGAWRQMISLPLLQKPSWEYFILIGLVFFGAYFWLRKNKKSAEGTSPLNPLLIGCIAIFLAGIPFWITGIPVQLDFPWDRSTMPFMLGTSLLTAGGLLLFRPQIRNILASILIALSIGMHYQNTLLYQKEWAKLDQFFWQLTWRAPSLKPGTVVISDAIPLFYYGDNNLTPVLNWTYAPAANSINIPYNFFDMGERLGKNLPDLKPDLPISHGYRFVNFESTSNALLPVFYKEGNCLRVVDEQTALLSSIPKRLRAVAEFSRPENLILTTPPSIPPAFIPEPAHGWCYYYQKAELAIQLSDWQSAIQYYRTVSDRNLSPADKTEWLPFIEGMIQTGGYPEAVKLSNIALEQEGAKPVICGLWNKMANEKPSQQDIGTSLGQIGCE